MDEKWHSQDIILDQTEMTKTKKQAKTLQTILPIFLELQERNRLEYSIFWILPHPMRELS
jgi:hypothetical protein